MTARRLRPQGPFPTIVAFDQTLMRPGCVLLQAVMGGMISGHDLELLSSVRGAEWLTGMTPDMKTYTIHTADEFDQVRDVISRFHESTTATAEESSS